MQATDGSPSRLVVLSANGWLQARLQQSLRGVVEEFCACSSVDEALRAAADAPAATVLAIDLDHRNATGLEALREACREEALAKLPLVAITREATQSLRAAAIDHGAADLLPYNCDDRILQAVVRAARRRGGSEPGRFQDALTGLLTFDRFWELAADDFAACQRARSSFALFAVAIRRLRSASDCYGFETGDRALRDAARCVAAAAGANGWPYRRRGASFGWAAAHPAAAEIQAQCRKVAAFVHELPPTVRCPQGMRLTAAVGAGCVGPTRIGQVTLAQVRKAASAALVAAEKQGDGAVVLRGPDEDRPE
jgi:diguanylate cyclase (GGDEF)-like protein